MRLFPKTTGWRIVLLMMAGFTAGFLLRSRGGRDETPSAEFSNSVSAGFRDALSKVLRGQPESAHDRIAKLKILDAGMKDDPVDCANQLSEMGAFALLDEAAIFAAIREASHGEPAIAVRLANAVRSPSLRGRLLTSAFKDALAKAPMSALDLYGGLPDHLKITLGSELGGRLGQICDPSLMNEIIRHPGADQRVIVEAMKGWIARNTTEALAFLERVDPYSLEAKHTWKEYIWDKFDATGNPDERLAFFDKLRKSERQNMAVVSALGSILATNPQRWEELSRSLTTDVKLTDVAYDAAVKAAKTSPENVLRLLDQIPGEKARANAARQATTSMLFRSGVGEPQYVFAWLKTIQDPIVAHAVVEELAYQRVPLGKAQ